MNIMWIDEQGWITSPSPGARGDRSIKPRKRDQGFEAIRAWEAITSPVSRSTIGFIGYMTAISWMTAGPPTTTMIRT